MRTRGTLAGGALALIVLAMPALGQSDDVGAGMDPADRVLVHGYDPSAMRLLWAAMLGSEATDECGLVDGEVDYDTTTDGTATVQGADGEACELEATDVSGPEGQVNHGTVVSAFVQALEASGYDGPMGCLVRIIAQSDYGKGDQQVRVGATDSPEGGSTVDITVTEASCDRPEETEQAGDMGNDAGPPDDRGRPPHAGPPHADQAHEDSHDSSDHGGGPPPWAGPPAGKGGGSR